MLSKELRTKYLEFFKSKGHMIHPSDSLVPDDPSLLYTSAGMVQFKPYFTGERIPPCRRLTDSQKCMRTGDIDEVGDSTHLTFFEMLGNFSIGDYFKREAIHWAWEFLTQVIKIDADRLWTSVYKDDDEAASVWIDELGFPKERLVRLGEDKNFWPADAPTKGPNGPCGPCNEIFLDMDPDKGYPEDPAWSIANDSSRFVEIWNLVFQQFDRKDDGSLVPLPTKNIDTGMGLERTIIVLNGLESAYETDLFVPIIEEIGRVTGCTYGSSDEVTRAMRVVADHIRSSVFAIADGVLPDNSGAGYVLRRIIRNAVVKGRKLGRKEPFLSSLVKIVVKMMGDAYPEIADKQGYIEKVIDSDENRCARTLESGMQRLAEMLEGAKVLPGESAFTLYDTYGFPFELTKEMAAEKGVEVDEEGFRAAMEKQRETATASGGFAHNLFGEGASVITELQSKLGATEFVGYGCTESEAEVAAIIKGGASVDSLSAGDEGEVILNSTPFYAEMGGQVGDTGTLGNFTVTDTVKKADFYVHVGKAFGDVKVGDTVCAKVDARRRRAIERNHSATHMLHAALHEVIGEHALQAGSVVDDKRLRFDFSHFQAVTPEEIRAIENKVNEFILSDLCVNTVVTDIEEARKMGATALFGEKYGNEVRVVKMGDVSMEFCGGTHLKHSSQAGLFKITGESSVGAGLRRIEAVTGTEAVKLVSGLQDVIANTAKALSCPVGDLESAAARTVEKLKEARKETEAAKAKGASEEADTMAKNAIDLGGVKFVAAETGGDVRALVDTVADKLGSGVIVLAKSGDRPVFVCKVTADLTGKGFHAGNIIREVAKVAGGGGGGKPEFAQAGGKDGSKTAAALAKAKEIVESLV